MVSRETRAIGVGLLSAFVAGIVFVAIELTVGFPGRVTSAATFVIVAVFGIALPQLYLARTDSTVPPQWRIRAVLVLFLLIGSALSVEATLIEGAIIWSIIAATFLVVIVSELRAGYLAAGVTESPEASVEE